ncbi:MAG: DUF805 domain-containing protein [Pseudorhodobacter sp.]|nr:DUF805 domain-containing protein [Frankiaceae bacterium]
MGLAEAVTTVIGKYADFSGRARRSEYWFWTLAVFLGYVVAAILTQIAGIFEVLLVLFYLAVLVPTIAVGVRRLHDTGKSGWFILLGLIPLVGGIVLLVFTVSDSTPGDNEYGPNPKGVGGGGGAGAALGYGTPV